MRARLLARLSSLVVVLALPAAVAAQTRFDAGVHVSFVGSGEFDTTTTGVGGRVAWYPSSWIGAEAELTFYPQDFPDGRAFTSSQREGLFGVTVGPRLGWVRPFARLRPGFVTFAEAPTPFPCILIFPPPLVCQLAGGADAGGPRPWRRPAVRQQPRVPARGRRRSDGALRGTGVRRGPRSAERRLLEPRLPRRRRSGYRLLASARFSSRSRTS